MNESIIRFSDVSFGFGHDKVILDKVNFSVRTGTKITLMGQNGAGKSTIFKLITDAIQPTDGNVSVANYLTVALAQQVIPREDRELTVEAFFHKYCPQERHELQRRISKVLDVVNLKAPLASEIQSFSGGQQARLLLASALIQEPDLLLLDEPTNNLDPAGIAHLTSFISSYPKSCVVISHDADFLNAFTEGVLYLDSFTHKVEQYWGDYYDVVADITARRERESRLNARMEKGIQEKKDQANVFAHKGGGMRLVAKRMRESAVQMESEKVAVRKEDKTIRPFTIPSQYVLGDIVTISSFAIMQNHELVTKQASIHLGKKQHLHIAGPNGIGKSTLIESLAMGTAQGAHIAEGVRVGYYRQDFSTLNFEDTALESLKKAAEASDTGANEELIRSTAAGFLITADLMNTVVGNLSEGQKGLVSFARLVLQEPGLLILDEPTNHINFRHLPTIAAALNVYEGAMIIASHVPEFIAQIKIDTVLDLEKV